MKKVIIYNTFDHSSIFFLAAAKNSGYTLISASKPSELWDSNAEEIILCNVKPKMINSSFQYHPDLEIYLNEKIKIISNIIFFPFKEWDRNNIKLNDLMTKYYNGIMRQNDRATTAASWQKNVTAARYVKALKTALVIGLNTKLDIYEKIYSEVVSEIAEQKPNSLVNSFKDLYSRVQETTERAIIHLKTNGLVQIPKREVAYAYLDNTSDYLDFSELRLACLKKYPYLSVIQYRQAGVEITWLMSNRKLDVGQFFQLPTVDKYEAIIIGSHRSVLLHLQTVIKDISK